MRDNSVSSNASRVGIAMAEGLANNPSSPLLDLSEDEWERLRKRREFVKGYQPPLWRSNTNDLVSGGRIEKKMVEHASILIHERTAPTEVLHFCT